MKRLTAILMALSLAFPAWAAAPAAAPASASFVDTAMSTGRPFRLWLLTASVGAVSYMPQASLPSVLPVHGARISRSSSFFGPMGSACAIV